MEASGLSGQLTQEDVIHLVGDHSMDGLCEPCV